MREAELPLPGTGRGRLGGGVRLSLGGGRGPSPSPNGAQEVHATDERGGGSGRGGHAGQHPGADHAAGGRRLLLMPRAPDVGEAGERGGLAAEEEELRGRPPVAVGGAGASAAGAHGARPPGAIRRRAWREGLGCFSFDVQQLDLFL